MSKIEHAYKHTVQYYETDKMGITHHSNYIRWMEEARIDFLDKIGFSYAKLEEMGVISPVISVDCKYKVSTTFSDEVTITTSIKEFNGVKLYISYVMTNSSDKLVAEGTSGHCFIGTNGLPLRLSKEFPDLYTTLTELSNNK